jgi:hypothetical protein
LIAGGIQCPDRAVTTSFRFSFALLAHPGHKGPGSLEGYPKR